MSNLSFEVLRKGEDKEVEIIGDVKVDISSINFNEPIQFCESITRFETSEKIGDLFILVQQSS